MEFHVSSRSRSQWNHVLYYSSTKIVNNTRSFYFDGCFLLFDLYSCHNVTLWRSSCWLSYNHGYNAFPWRCTIAVSWHHWRIFGKGVQ